tara:strand:- start:211726 stop:212637 length:912 start_codon:yes stop_codon:yes gene_type:complete
MKLSLIARHVAGLNSLDRIFYVPFWECPYMCDFCCVDSLPGKPPADLQAGEPILFALMDRLYENTGRKQQVHVYGGEPMLRPDYMYSLARSLKDRPSFDRFYMYSTLRPGKEEPLVDILGPEKLKIIVNPDTATDSIREKVQQYGRAHKGMVEFYFNPTFFPTGRGSEDLSGYKPNWMQKYLPTGIPGRACFARISGMLVNGPDRSVHLCCLPQSPVVGNFADQIHEGQDSESLEERSRIIYHSYLQGLKNYPSEVNSRARQEGRPHPCSVCNHDHLAGKRLSSETDPKKVGENGILQRTPGR